MGRDVVTHDFEPIVACLSATTLSARSTMLGYGIVALNMSASNRPLVSRQSKFCQPSHEVLLSPQSWHSGGTVYILDNQVDYECKCSSEVMFMRHRAKIKFIDLFAGMGGFRLGFEQACIGLGFEPDCVFASEIKQSAVEVYSANFGSDHLHGDIFKIRESDIPSFSYLLAGFPCQAFSSAGKRQGFTDTRGTLFFEIERILAHHKPAGFILENVEGLIRHDLQTKGDKVGRTLNIILSTLSRLGYKVTWRLLDASHFGVAQARKRVFIVGTRKSAVSLSSFPHETAKIGDVLQSGLAPLNTKIARLLLESFKPEELYGKSVKDKRGGSSNIHSWDIALKGSTTLVQRKILSDIITNRRSKRWAELKGIRWMDGMPLTLNEIASFSSIKKDKLKMLLDDLVEKGYLSYEHPKDLVRRKNSVGKMVVVREPRDDLEKGYNIVAGKLSFGVSKILDPRDVCPTLVATDVERLAVIDGKGIRRLSITELLRLSGFPDDFQLPVSNLECYDLLGNTVVVPVIRAIASRLIETTEFMSTKWLVEEERASMSQGRLEL